MINKEWTLFLDRDGVLNKDVVNGIGYVIGVENMNVLPGVPEAMQKLSLLFGTIVICTNQRSIGKGLLSLEEFHRMNEKMLSVLEPAGGRIDKIYFAPDLEDDAFNRKPKPGMALQAKQDFPHIDFSKSVMVGNNLSDMQFARNAGINETVFVTTTIPDVPYPNPLIDKKFDSLKAYADSLG
ncbi:hypothetical protein A9P82_11760 [Arachidicoccus ginsenosidimutans]|uniref:D-glycero-alpha-D-manno-heptose-1,7-bisphosphate 7-phosphatase n=1 Tax=Arachidicoccus sp. BS20 TaxID=1850526 RepID=UPI0007F130D7|nr:HAD-IIIA family hydrolase [Arachidicoccus sp. BS20]ANI89901.1 hypothetical protein A9P82_11760 [Arachidicoccus sp. BS20]